MLLPGPLPVESLPRPSPTPQPTGGCSNRQPEVYRALASSHSQTAGALLLKFLNVCHWSAQNVSLTKIGLMQNLCPFIFYFFPVYVRLCKFYSFSFDTIFEPEIVTRQENILLEYLRYSTSPRPPPCPGCRTSWPALAPAQASWPDSPCWPCAGGQGRSWNRTRGHWSFCSNVQCIQIQRSGLLLCQPSARC